VIRRDQFVATDAGGLPGVGGNAVVAVRLSDGSNLTFMTRRLGELEDALNRGGYPTGVV
jgi:hypothetical protein